MTSRSSSSAFEALVQHRRQLALDIAGKPATAADRTKELAKINDELAACGQQLALLEEAEQAAADRDRVEAFERGKQDTVGARDAAIAAAKARVKVAEKLDAAFDTIAALLTTWEGLTQQVRQGVREVCTRTPPNGRKQPTHERLTRVSSIVEHSGAPIGLSHRIFWSGLGRKGIEVDIILGQGFGGFGYDKSKTVAAEAAKGVELLERALGHWIEEAGTLSRARQEQE